ncbi:DinB family protein [Sporosarcina sp. GW1-11]|uniref:DinB family protein n=1 Tax=Sporosarcina sp. GW1-11 TaxID=2899126 RepID=UPI00294D3617|nr:DinB family protein [Sporosarcina sp. GW1-11]MDV6379511.1 DinB family protein [Sporosarcina sp. GW1-11]
MLVVFGENIKVRKRILQLIEGLTDEEFNGKPSNGGWSPKQIVEHLALMECQVATNIAKELKNPDSLRVFKKPISVCSSPLWKAYSLEYTDPTDIHLSISDIKERLHQSRNFLLDIYDSATEVELRGKSLKHPVFGNVPLIQWFHFVGFHEKRHLRQLKRAVEQVKTTKLSLTQSYKY